MDELESQIAKIQLGNFRNSNSFVFVFAEKAGGSNAELYMVAELPLLNPAAEDSCEKICLSIVFTLKRVYKKPLSPASFETAVSQINEELGKLASLGQTHWIDRLNCSIGVKDGEAFTIATCGKVSGFLLREGEFTDISCSGAASHPLKTFENYASGKIRLGDLLILSNTQLFNYLSMDRFKTITASADFLTATQTIIELLKQNAGPEVAFGSLLNLQVAPGQTTEEEIDLENYVLAKPAGHINFLKKAADYVKTLFAFNTTKRAPKVGLPKISFDQRIRTIGGGAKNLWNKSKGALSAVGRGVKTGSDALRWQNFKGYSRTKKFFFASAAVLLLAVLVNIYVSVHYKNIKQQEQQQAVLLKQVQTLLSNAQSSMVYRDDNSAKDYLAKAQKQLPDGNVIKPANKNLYNDLSSQISGLREHLEKVTEVQAANLGNLSRTNNLIKLPGILGTFSGGNIVSFTADGKIQDGALKTNRDILDSIFTEKNSAVIFDGNQFYVWDFSTGQTGLGYSFSVPGKEDLAGLAYYPTNSRVYALNKTSGQVVSYAVAANTLGKAVVSINDPSLKDAQDLAIDSSVYVLTSAGINKYQSGRLVAFKMPSLLDPFSGKGKIETGKDFKNIYVLDSGKNRIIIVDKRGNLVEILKSSQFTKLADFQVDEKSKTIYLLNDSSLLKVTMP